MVSNTGCAQAQMATATTPISKVISVGCGFEILICLKLGYRQELTISKDTIPSKINQITEKKKERTGDGSTKTTAATKPAAAGIGMPTKYFRSGRPGFFGIGLVCTLKRANLTAPHRR